jgi:transposase-like protein
MAWVTCPGTPGKVGSKGKALRTRVSELALRAPQVRALPGGEAPSSYQKSLERGMRRERALEFAIAEMVGQGVTTRRVVVPNLRWQPCQVHLQQNALAYVSSVAPRPQVAFGRPLKARC